MEKDYQAFVETLKTKLHEMTGIPCEDMCFEKQGSRFAPDGDRLLVRFARHEEAWEVCGFYTKEIFETYTNGRSIEEITEEMVNHITQIKEADVYERTKRMENYEESKKYLFIRLLNAEKYALDLQDAVYRMIGDIALVLYLKVGEHKNCISSTKIRQNIIMGWGRPEDEVFKEALLNTYFMTPPRIYRWEQMIFDADYEGDNFMDLTGLHQLKKNEMGNCLSTTQKTNGAVAVFLPGVAERLAYLLNSDFFMVFTSIHEVMIHSDTTVTPQELKSVLKDTMEEATPEEDYLSSEIYHYSRNTHQFTCVEV